MKKTVLLSLLMAMMGMSAAQVVDTFELTNMPRNYYLGNDWLDYNNLCIPRIPLHSDGKSCSGAQLAYEPIICRPTGWPGPADYGLFSYVHMGNIWEQNHIRNFAVGKYADTTIRVVGIALLLPRYYYSSEIAERYTVRNMFISHNFDTLKLQLMDSLMNVLSEGSADMTDSVGKPLFLFNKERKEVYEYTLNTSSDTCVDVNAFQIYYDIYEVYFNKAETVTDSFYLSAHFKSQQYGNTKVGIAIPGMYELHTILGTPGHYSPSTEYFSPELTWKAQGGYRTFYTSATGVTHEPVDDSVWFTLDNCEPNHGHMLIFPILETSCHVPTGLRWNPMGGGKVRLSWESGTWDTEWEVSYGLSGIAPEDGTIITATSTSAQLSGIGTDTHYVAYVRTKCVVRDTVWSDWSDSISIFLSTQGIDNMDKDGGIALQPNPASNSVLLTTEAPLTGIDVYTAAGAFYKHLPASGNAADIDVSSWPSGTYLLHISTPLGVTTKKLIVQ